MVNLDIANNFGEGTEVDMDDRILRIRAEERKYHEACYDNYTLFEAGTWLHKPVKSVMDALDFFDDYESLSASAYLKKAFEGWTVLKSTIKSLVFNIEREKRNILLKTDCLTWIVQKS